MAKQNAKSAANDIQSLFDPKGYQDVFKTWASTTERMTAIAVEAATRSTDIASDTAKETFSNLRDVTTVRDEPADYGKAYSDFVQKQMDLTMRAAQGFADVNQKAGTETTDLATKTGEEIADKVGANVNDAAEKAGSAAKKAA